MTNQIKPDAEYGADSDVARFFGIHPKSLRRWDARPELGFPPAIRVNGRKYRRWTEVQEFARRAAAAHAAGKPKNTATT